MRADAARNRGRLVEAAEAVFAEQGLDAPAAEVARRAGVGAGTLFRHFPTKDDLVAAIVHRRFDDMQAAADRALQAEDAGPAFERFLWDAAELHAADRGLVHAVRHRALDSPALAPCRASLRASVDELIERAQAAGALREDVRGDDVPQLLSAITGAGDGWRRYLAIVIDGLSTSAEARASARPRS